MRAGVRLLLLLLLASIAGADEITLVWDDNSDNETGFILERADGAGDALEWAEVGRTGPDVARFRDTDLDPGATYSYRVCAYNARGRSGYSNIYALPAVPAPPGNVRGLPSDVAVVTLPPGTQLLVAAAAAAPKP